MLQCTMQLTGQSLWVSPQKLPQLSKTADHNLLILERKKIRGEAKHLKTVRATLRYVMCCLNSPRIGRPAPKFQARCIIVQESMVLLLPLATALEDPKPQP